MSSNLTPSAKTSFTDIRRCIETPRNRGFSTFEDRRDLLGTDPTPPHYAVFDANDPGGVTKAFVLDFSKLKSRQGFGRTEWLGQEETGFVGRSRSDSRCAQEPRHCEH